MSQRKLAVAVPAHLMPLVVSFKYLWVEKLQKTSPVFLIYAHVIDTQEIVAILSLPYQDRSQLVGNTTLL